MNSNANASLPTHAQPGKRSAGARLDERRIPDLPEFPPFVRAVRGRLGDVVFKTYGRKIIVTRVPRFDGYVPTAAQRARRDKMRAATAFAHRVYADPTARAIYVAAAKRLDRQPFRLAVSDYLRGYDRLAAADTHRPPFLLTVPTALATLTG